MTTRLHRLWKQGNPQTRVFLPNFWVRLVKPEYKEFIPPNVVKFECSLHMSTHDVQEYMEKIYKLPVRQVRTSIIQGQIQSTDKMGRYPVVAFDKEEDVKVAYVTLPRYVKFEFPELFPNKGKSQAQVTKDLQSKTMKEREEAKEGILKKDINDQKDQD